MSGLLSAPGDRFDLDRALKVGAELPKDISIAYMAPANSVSVATAQTDLDFIDGRWIDVRSTPDIDGLLPETVLAIRNAEINFRGAIRLSDGTRLESSFFITRPGDWDTEGLQEPERIVGPHASIVQGAAGFGHWLIHRLSRLITVRDFVPDLPLLSTQLPISGDEFYARTGWQPQEVRRLPRRQRKTFAVDELFVPSYAGVNRGRLADASRFGRDIERLIDGIDLRTNMPAYPEKIYLPRRTDSSSRAGAINGLEIEKLFVERGFHAIDPGSLSFDEQVRLIRSAKVIAGEGGSAAQNAMFGNKGLTVIVVNGNSGPGTIPYRPGRKTYARMVTDAFECNYRRIVASEFARFPGWKADTDIVRRALDSMPE